jgi:hypothetical protein
MDNVKLDNLEFECRCRVGAAKFGAAKVELSRMTGGLRRPRLLLSGSFDHGLSPARRKPRCRTSMSGCCHAM